MFIKNSLKKTAKYCSVFALASCLVSTHLSAADNNFDDSIDFNQAGALYDPANRTSSRSTNKERPKNSKPKRETSAKRNDRRNRTDFEWFKSYQNYRGRFYTVFAAGPGFVKLRKVKGSLNSIPAPAGASGLSGANFALKGVRANNPAACEIGFGYHVTNWFGMAITSPNQSNIKVSSDVVNGGGPTQFAQFTGDVDLQGLQLKLLLNAPPIRLCPSMMCNFQLKGGAGLGWQSWGNMKNTQAYTVTGLTDIATLVMPLKAKTISNLLYEIGGGFMINGTDMSGYPGRLSAGIEAAMIYWGKARHLGKLDQNGSSPFALAQPISIKSLASLNVRFRVAFDF